MFLSKIFANLRLGGQLCQISQNEVNTISRNLYVHVHKPKPGVKGKSYRRIVHFEENYTIKPLNVTNLAGRDPDTGNLLVKTGTKCSYWKLEASSRGCIHLANVCHLDFTFIIF